MTGSNPVLATNKHNINLNKGDTNIDRSYLITLVGQAVFGCRQIIGFTESNDEGIINRYIEEYYNVSLNSVIHNKFTFQNGCHWEYSTNRENVDIHVDLIYNIKKEI